MTINHLPCHKLSIYLKRHARLTVLLAAEVLGAAGVLAHGTISIYRRAVLFGALVARADDV